MTQTEKTQFSARIDRATHEALREFARQVGLTVADAANLCLAAGLGRQRLALSASQGTGLGETLNVPGPTAASSENGAANPVAVSAAPTENVDVEVEIQARLWGFYAEETASIEQYPEFILNDPATARARLTNIIGESERLGLERPSRLHSAYVEARVAGLTSEQARETLARHGPARFRPCSAN
jgi:hypothetical protein